MGARPRILLTLATAIALVGGCGGGGEDDAGPTKPTKAEFIKQANAACEEERAGLMKRVADFERNRSGGRPEPGADMVHFVYLPTMEAQVFRIEELGVPRGESIRIDMMLDASRFAIDAVAVKPRVPSMEAAERHFAEADKLFLEYGLDSCATESESQA